MRAQPVRERLPNRRKNETVDFVFRGLEYSASLGLYPDGRPAELFLNCVKHSTDSDNDARDAAILISFALQHGATVDELASAMARDVNGAPQGIAGHALDQIIEQLKGWRDS
jgi:hypothetical protein